MADPNTPRYSNDERLTEAQREQYDAAYHALQGQGGHAGGGGGAAAAVMTPLIILGTFVVFMFYACFYPMAAGVAIVVGVVVSKTFGFFVPGVGWIMHYLIALPLAFSALMMFREREWQLELKPAYVRTRHVLRLVFTALIVSTTATFLMKTDQAPGSPLEQPLNWTHFTIVVASVVIVHVVGRWLDRRTIEALAEAGLVETAGPARPARPRASGRWQIAGIRDAPPPLSQGLPVMAMAGGVFGAFLGFAAFETSLSTLIGLFIGCVAGALLMFASWMITRPVGALFDRQPLLWPLLMGAIVGAVIAWRLAQADKVMPTAYLAQGMLAGAVALALPYLLYVGSRRLFTPQT